MKFQIIINYDGSAFRIEVHAIKYEKDFKNTEKNPNISVFGTIGNHLVIYKKKQYKASFIDSTAKQACYKFSTLQPADRDE